MGGSFFTFAVHCYFTLFCPDANYLRLDFLAHAAMLSPYCGVELLQPRDKLSCCRIQKMWIFCTYETDNAVPAPYEISSLHNWYGRRRLKLFCRLSWWRGLEYTGWLLLLVHGEEICFFVFHYATSRFFNAGVMKVLGLILSEILVILYYYFKSSVT